MNAVFAKLELFDYLNRLLSLDVETSLTWFQARTDEKKLQVCITTQLPIQGSDAEVQMMHVLAEKNVILRQATKGYPDMIRLMIQAEKSAEPVKDDVFDWAKIELERSTLWIVAHYREEAKDATRSVR